MTDQTADVWIVPEVELYDVSLTEQILLRRFYEDVDGVKHEEEAQEPLPEDVVAKMEELTGDMKGRVTVGVDLASSVEFGMKAGAFVSIGVSCDSNEEVIEEVHGIMSPLAQKLAIEDHAEMSAIRDSMLPVEKQLGDACPQVTKEGKKRARPKKSGGKKTRFRSR